MSHLALAHAQAPIEDHFDDRWTPEVYEQLRRLARSQRHRRARYETLDTTGLVHEAYLKLSSHPEHAWRDRGHFFAVSATAMRQILIDAARSRLSQKRGGGQDDATLGDDVAIADAHALDVLAVNEALAELKTIDPRLCQLVECRFFAGLTHEETALAMNSSERTVYRDWLRAKAWLRRALGGRFELD
ncbi:MAG: ECF-type sigma factor [Acidobacteriota bacterium]